MVGGDTDLVPHAFVRYDPKYSFMLSFLRLRAYLVVTTINIIPGTYNIMNQARYTNYIFVFVFVVFVFFFDLSFAVSTTPAELSQEAYFLLRRIHYFLNI